MNFAYWHRLWAKNQDRAACHDRCHWRRHQ